MKFSADIRSFKDVINKMSFINAKKEMSPNLCLSKHSKEESTIVIKCVGEEAYATAKLPVKFLDEDYTSIVINHKDITHLPDDFSTYNFSTTKSKLKITSDNDNIKYTVPLYPIDDFVDMPLVKPEIVNIPAEICDKFKSFIKQCPNFTLKGETGNTGLGRNRMYTSVNIKIRKYDDWCCLLESASNASSLSYRLPLSNYSGEELTYYIPYIFFTEWNSLDLSKGISLGVIPKTGFIVLNAGLILGCHNTYSGEDFVDIEGFVNSLINHTYADVQITIRPDSLLKNIGYISSYVDQKNIVTLTVDITDDKMQMYTTDMAQCRTLQKGKDGSLIDIAKEGSFKVDMKQFSNCLNALKSMYPPSSTFTLKLANNKVCIYDDKQEVSTVLRCLYE